MLGWYDVKSTVDIPSTPGFTMSIRSKLRSTCLIFILVSGAVLRGQSRDNAIGGSGSLRQHYNDAQKLQQAGNLSGAADQYRAFLSDALGQLAVGYLLVPDYSQAAPLFDEALTLEPDSPSLLLDYARTTFMMGDLDHAKTLATEF